MGTLILGSSVVVPSVTVNGGSVQPVIDPLSITPTTSQQTITAPSGTDGYSPITVNAVTSNIDDNIVAGNIKKDVEILGVTGTYEGVVPSGILSISQNGTYDVTNYATADVNVSSTAPAHYIEKTVDANGKLVNSTNIINFNGVTDVDDYVLEHAYYEVSFPTNTSVSMPLTTLSGIYACRYMFQNCIELTSVSFPYLNTISGNAACSYMFDGCTDLTNISFPALDIISGQSACSYMFHVCNNLAYISLPVLTTISGVSACQNMFSGCSNLTDAPLPALTTISGNTACRYMFQSCTGLTSVSFPVLTTISGSGACNYMFQNCTNLIEVNLSGLTSLSGSYAFQNMFQNCTSLMVVNIGNTTAINFGTTRNQFQNMFAGCPQNITVCVPAANQGQIEAFPQYPKFGATGTVTWVWRS